MKHIFIIICSILLPIYCLKVTKPKLCINCKFFIPDNGDGEYGKCSLFPRREDNDNYLVNGINYIAPTDYSYCVTTRHMPDMCGKEGKLHKRKYIKKIIR